jgi:RNA polymerase sigma-70 factor, ECF subfamily
MRDLTFTEVERLEPEIGEAEAAFQMNEDTFRAFYDRTARAIWVYLSRMTGDRQLAEDLLQETYYRFLRADRTFESDVHRRNYLFRIATNLVHDGHRRSRHVDYVRVPDEDSPDALQADGDIAERTARRADLTRALARLKPRERDLLWLAYAQGSTHQEIAESLGLRTSSIKLLLFRARRRLLALLGSTGSSSGSGNAGDGLRRQVNRT